MTARSNNKEWFYLPILEVWGLMIRVLDEVSVSYAANILAFVLMDNHFHMLIGTPLKNLDQIMNYFMRETSRHIGKSAGRINHIYGGRYKSTLITDAVHFAHVYKYVYRNPARAKIVSKVEDYAFSSLQALLAIEPCFFPIRDLDTELARRVPTQWQERLAWLNEPPPKEHDELTRLGLRRVEFAYSKQKSAKPWVKQLMEFEKEVGT